MDKLQKYKNTLILTLLTVGEYQRDYGDNDLGEIGLDLTTGVLLMLSRYWFIWLPFLVVVLFLAWLLNKIDR